MAEWLASHLGPAAPRIEVVANALPAVYRPRSQLDQPLILAAGRLVREKQYDHMISAFGAVNELLPDWRLRIFGEGIARPELVGVIRKEGLYDRAELLGFTTDAASEWAKASIGVLTSVGEGSPLQFRTPWPREFHSSPTTAQLVPERSSTTASMAFS